MSSNFTPIEGDEIERTLDIIEDNGGAGTWESGAVEEIERWEFPRFDGASDKADMYLSRTGLGPYDTDVETICAWLDAPRNVVGAVLLLGNPGTGKTALIEAAVTHSDRELTTILCTPDHTKDSLFLRFVGEGKGDPVDPSIDLENLPKGMKPEDVIRSPYSLGPVPHAVKYGRTLYMDEFMLLVDGVKPIFYSLADGRRFLPEGNIDGSALEVHPDFRLILSSNPMVRGASLPEPVASRCASTTMTVETAGSMLLDLGIDESIVAAWGALISAGLWHPEVREMRLADYWMSVDPAQAVSAMIPEHCPESQRSAVRDMVVSFMGGDIRADGRLVVR